MEALTEDTSVKILIKIERKIFNFIMKSQFIRIHAFHLMILISSYFYQYILLWPTKSEYVKVMVLAVDKFSLDSFHSELHPEVEVLLDESHNKH